jgi:hypothetical protein
MMTGRGVYDGLASAIISFLVVYNITADENIATATAACTVLDRLIPTGSGILRRVREWYRTSLV